MHSGTSRPRLKPSTLAHHRHLDACRQLLRDVVELLADDVILVIAEQEDAIGQAAARLGRLAPGQLVKDRADLDYIRVFVGKANVVGMPLSRLPMPASFPVHLLHVRRYDVDLVPTPDLMLEFGDRVGVLMPPDRREEVRKHFGDTIKAAAEFSYVSLGIGMVLGVLLGLIPIPIPGVGTVTLGIGGGPLIVALILGNLRYYRRVDHGRGRLLVCLPAEATCENYLQLKKRAVAAKRGSAPIASESILFSTFVLIRH